MVKTEEKMLSLEKKLSEIALTCKAKEELDQKVINTHVNHGFAYIQEQLFGLNKTEIFEGLYFRIPMNFQLMREEFIKRKYPNESRPQIVYTNHTTKINIAFSRLLYKVEQNEFPQFVDNIINSVKKLYPDNPFFDVEKKEIRRIQLGYFDFVTHAFDGNIYNFMFLFLYKEEVIIGSINCDEEKINTWKPLAIAIMSSIRIRRKENE